MASPNDYQNPDDFLKPPSKVTWALLASSSAVVVCSLFGEAGETTAGCLILGILLISLGAVLRWLGRYAGWFLRELFGGVREGVDARRLRRDFDR